MHDFEDTKNYDTFYNNLEFLNVCDGYTPKMYFVLKLEMYSQFLKCIFC